MLAEFDGDEISLSLPEVGVPEHPWDNDGWKLCLLVPHKVVSAFFTINIVCYI